MYTSEQAGQAFNLLREAQDIKKELQKKRQHMDEQVYVKSLVSLNDTCIRLCIRKSPRIRLRTTCVTRQSLNNSGVIYIRTSTWR